MAAFMRRWEPQAYAVLRIVTGLVFLWHGTQKLFGFPEPMPPGVPALITWVAGPIELVGGALVMIGLATRWAAFICSGQMAVAYWIGHGYKVLFPPHFEALFPSQNGGELAVLYCFVFLFLSAGGPGIWSVDGARSGAT